MFCYGFCDWIQLEIIKLCKTQLHNVRSPDKLYIACVTLKTKR